MTHFNHEWDTAKTPAVPVSVGDRYYAQDLNDDFNYLKHLPYEVFLQGRSRGVMVAPSDTWNNDTNSLTLSGGFGVILQDCVELDPNEDFVIPPKTQNSPRYERVPFADTTLIIPTDSTIRYIVATPTKRSLLQRVKTLFTEQYASRVRYDGIITIQDTAPTAGQILVGLCYNREYCLLIDSNPNQCKDNIILKKWFGQAKITQGFVPALQSYYNTSIASIETKISINTVSGENVNGISGGTFDNCTIDIDTVYSDGNYSTSGIEGGTFNNCTITINTVYSDGYGVRGIHYGTFNNCIISISTINSGGSGIYGSGTFNTCIITINTVGNNGAGINNSAYEYNTFNTCIISINTVTSGTGIGGGTFNNCIISIDTVNNYGISGGTFDNCIISIGTTNNRGINNGTFNNCTISIDTVNSGDGIGSGTFNNCTIIINKVNSGGGIGVGTFNNCTIIINKVNTNGPNYGISNDEGVILNLTYIRCTAVTNLSNTGGKLNVLNSTILHAS